MLKTRWRYLLLGVLLYGIGAAFFLSTSPESLPVGLLVLPFLYIFICLYITALGLLTLAKGWVRYKRLLAGVVATIGTLLLLLSSLHQLTIRDIILSVSVALLLMWYLHKSQQTF